MELKTVSSMLTAHQFFKDALIKRTSNEEVVYASRYAAIWHNLTDNYYYPCYYSIKRNKASGQISYTILKADECVTIPLYVIKKAIALNVSSATDKAKETNEFLTTIINQRGKANNEKRKLDRTAQKNIQKLSTLKADNPLFDVIVTLASGAQAEYFCSYAYYACSKSTSNFIVCRHIEPDNRALFKVNIWDVKTVGLKIKNDAMN
jgi:hypothetical protein